MIVLNLSLLMFSFQNTDNSSYLLITASSLTSSYITILYAQLIYFTN